MSPAEAAQLLEIPADATPEQIEARFLELRRKLEDKIAKAPTPGLQAKYRESLAEITAAFELLALAADSSALPVLNKQSAVSNQPSAKPANPAPPAPPPAVRTSNSGKKNSSKEFLIVAIVAVAVLGAGGWWVMKTRAENAENARLATEAKAEADRQSEAARLAQATAEKQERERLEGLNARLRSRLAELNVTFEAVMRHEQTAERELSELKSEERSHRGAETPALRALQARVQAQDRLVDWLRDNLAAHPAKVARAQAEELLGARSLDAAATALDHYAKTLQQLQADVATAKAANITTGTLVIEGNTAGVQWQLKDSFGVERKGSAPANLQDIALGAVDVTLSLEGFPDATSTLKILPDTPARLVSNFVYPTLTLISEPSNARIWINGSPADPGRTMELRPGTHTIRVEATGYAAAEARLRVAPGDSLVRRVALSNRPGDRALQLAFGGLLRETDRTFLMDASTPWIARAYGSYRSNHQAALVQVQELGAGATPASLIAALAQVAAEKGWSTQANAAVNVIHQLARDKKLDAKTFPASQVLLASILTRQTSRLENAYDWYRAQNGRSSATYVANDLLRIDRVELAEEWMQRWRNTEKGSVDAWHQKFGEDYYNAMLFKAHVSANRIEAASTALTRFLNYAAQTGNFTNLEWSIPDALRDAHRKGNREMFDLIVQRVEPLIIRPPTGYATPDWWFEMLALAGRAAESKAGLLAAMEKQRAQNDKRLAHTSTVAVYATILVDEGAVAQAYETAAWAWEPADVMRSLAQAFAERGDWTAAAEAFRRAPIVRRSPTNWSDPTMTDAKALRQTMLASAYIYGISMAKKSPTNAGLDTILGVKDTQVRLLALAGFAQHLVDHGQTREALLENEASPAGELKPAPPQGTLVRARILKRGTLAYPAAMERAGIDGRVLLRVAIAANGAVTETTVIESTDPLFTDAALAYARTLTFAPATQGGQPVASSVDLPIVFTLD